ncbi:MAG: hypothetical protein L6R41_003510 [Letrouitia leprolyta]|nr:MAG: hypothetical protein L6R41_003510 [Letrouitia leprolyta]
MVGSVTRQNSVEKSRHLSSTRQTQRKMFAGSRHARTLSLLSTSSVLQRSSRQLADKPTFRDSSAIQISTVALNNAQGSNIQSPVSPLTRYESGNGKSKEVFIETGKQLVGDLREGLWTFFEDLRQATVGEEASSIPYYSSKVRPFSRHNVRMKDHRKDESPGMLRKTEKRLDESQAPITSRSNAVEHRLSATQAVEKEKETEMEEVRPNIQQNGVGTPSIESDEDESWDVWDTPVAKGSVPREQSESVTSGSLASPSANDYSPRSSMR